MSHDYVDPINKERRRLTFDQIQMVLTGPQQFRLFDGSDLGSFMNRAIHADDCPCRKGRNGKLA